MIEKTNKDCIFCKIVRGEIKDDIIYESDNFIVVNDIKPAIPGHCLIISKNHYETILDIPLSLGMEFIDIVKKQGLRLIKENKADGFNLVQSNFKAGGQVVPHFHTHILPRKLNDGFKLIKFINESNFENTK